MIKVIEAEGALLDQAEALVKRVFPHRDFAERMSFWAYRRQGNSLVQRGMRLFGVSKFLRYWVAVTDQGKVGGIVGLYTTPGTEHEAVWLSWFCVDPAQRGQGIGGQLIEFAIAQAKATGKKILRLYTSNDPNEAAAQVLYEKYGFKITKEEKRFSYVTYYRTLPL